MDIPQSSEKKLYDGKPAPLLCWDIFSDYLARQRSRENDIIFISNFLKDKFCPTLSNWKNRIKNTDAVVITSVGQIIEWVSSGFFTMTGYTKDEALNKKPSFLQGEKTNILQKQEIKDKLFYSKQVDENLINYKKSGKEYLCHIEVEPVFDKKKKLINFIAFEKEVI